MKRVPQTMHVMSSYSTTDVLSYSRVAQSLARDYIMVYYVNTKSDRFVQYIAHEDDHELVIALQGDDFFGGLKNFIPRIHPEDRNTFLTACTKENVLHVLSVDRSFILNFRMNIDGKETHLEVKVTRMVGADKEHIVVGIMDIDAHTRRVAEYERARRDSVTFASILEAMTTDYLAIFYVDLVSGDYVEYEPNKSYRGVGMDKEGSDFFNTRGRDIVERLHETDRPAIARLFSARGINEALAKSQTIISMCRLIRDGKELFVNIKATRMGGDDRHVVIGVNNIDDQVRREEAHAAALTAAQAVANRDSLTGVKSKHAFAEAESSYNQWIKDDKTCMRDFCVVVCDVNNLKYVNDTFGHKAGDEYIRNASRLICTCFKHSPVYRVGGDEFVIILTGDDFDHRKELLAQINAQVEENQRSGDVVIAIGSSDFMRDRDRGFIPVFNRADHAMYVRKLELKGKTDTRPHA